MNRKFAITAVKNFGPLAGAMVLFFFLIPKRQALLYDAAYIALYLAGWVDRRHDFTSRLTSYLWGHVLLFILGIVALFWLYSPRTAALMSGVGTITFVISEWSYRRKRTS